ncbi:MAG: rhomboid family intramembrane serine protease [Candidatus Anstonellales archaeon]
MIYNTLLLLNIIIFIIELIDRSVIYAFGFIPERALIEPWRFVTGMFLHGGLIHLFFNMFVLYSVGRLIEPRIGSEEFLKMYLLAGIAGNFLFLIIAYAGFIPKDTIGIGASGAIAGLLGAAYVFYPYITILLFFIIPIPMYVFFFLYLIIEFLGIFTMNYTGIGSAAHLGGALFGYFYSNHIKERERYW